MIYIRATIVGAAIAALVGIWFHGVSTGESRADARHGLAIRAAQQQAFEAAEAASIKEAQRLAAAAERDTLARELEDLANADPDTGGGLPAGRVQRLNSY